MLQCSQRMRWSQRVGYRIQTQSKVYQEREYQEYRSEEEWQENIEAKEGGEGYRVEREERTSKTNPFDRPI